jgi:hypothetical protein
VIGGKFARLGDDEIVIFREIHDEIESHRFDLAQARIENDAFEIA